MGSEPVAPFCSERCHMTDLGAWASGWYGIAGPTLTVPPFDKPFDSAQGPERVEGLRAPSTVEGDLSLDDAQTGSADPPTSSS